MVSLLAALLLAPALPASAQFDVETYSPQEIEAARLDPMRFTLDDAATQVTMIGPGDVSKPPAPPTVPPAGPGVSLDKILNTALALWQIIESNRPVVDVQTDYAVALPEGITHWAQLERWGPPEGTVFALTAKNLYGANVVDVRWRVQRIPGGSYQGKGKYLAGVTVVPEKVEVAWGYRFNLAAKVPSVTNAGSREDPVAAMVAELRWRIATAVKFSEATSSYYLKGDGAFQEIGK